MEQSFNSIKLGVIYRKENFQSHMEHIVNELESFINLKIQFIDESNYSESSLPDDLDAIVIHQTDFHILKVILSKNLGVKWVHTMSGGVEKFLSIKELMENDSISLTNSRGAFGDSLSEFSIFSMLYFSYNSPAYIKSFKERCWYQPKTNKMLKSKTLTIVGYGSMGIALAKKARGFDMKIIGFKRNITEAEGKEYVDELFEISKLNEILPQTDFLVSILPYTKETNDFFDFEKFSKLKPTSVFINIGRGNSVKEEDLIKCLKEKIIFAASLDVYKEEPLKSDSPLYDLENVYISCHSADLTDEYFNQAFDFFLKNLRLYLTKRKLLTIVDKNKGY